MTIILEGKDVLKYHPSTGKILKPKDFVEHVDSCGRVIIMLGDSNQRAKARIELSKQEQEN